MDSAIQFNVRNRLREIRQQRQLAIYGLSVLSGASPTTICAVEKWDYQPRLEVRRRLANALGVDVIDIWPVEDAQI
jgi:DNA-binding XRE family transcriptional regulator